MEGPALLFLGLLVIGVAAEDVFVSVPGLGRIAGTTDRSLWSRRTIYEFRSIPYAKPPSGSRRFKPPEPAIPWKGTLNATQFGRECPQAITSDELASLFSRGATEDLEDCLTLNIFTPLLPGACPVRFPVMYYVHGGSFRVGSAKAYRGTHLLERDVILVTVQYRLGPLGFLSLQNDDIAGNMGLLDQILGLRWVQKHIRGFCGDPKKVTVFGQSAGGAAVSIMLISPMAKGLFHRAIIQSGSALCEWAVNENPEQYARSISSLVGCGNGTKQEIASCLSKVTPYRLVEAQSSLVMETMMEESRSGAGGLRASDVSGSHAVVQVAGQKVLAEPPAAAFLRGAAAPLPLLVGVTKHEGTFIVGDIYDFYDRNISFSSQDSHSPDLLKIVLTYAGIDDVTDAVRDVFEKYFFSEENMGNFTKMIPGLADMCGSLLLKACTFKVARLVRKQAPSYIYTFNYKGSHTKFGYGRDLNYTFPGGVAHSDELVYLFPTEGQTLNEEDSLIAKRMIEYWTNFARTGQPGETKEEWPRLSTPYGPYMVIDKESQLKEDFTKEYTITVKEGLSDDPSSSSIISLFPISVLLVIACLLLKSVF